MRWPSIAMGNRRLRLVADIFASAAIIFAPSAATSRSFQAASQLTTWYTDRSPIDVEIVGVSGQGNEARVVEPARVLRLRLERAYVQLLIRRDQPPSSHVSISFDLPTGLPSALFQAPPAQVDAHGDSIQQLTIPEWAPRTVNVSLAGNNLTGGLALASSELSSCKGSRLQDDLFLFDKDQNPSCFKSSLGSGSKYVAQFSDDILLLVRCSNAPVGCQMFVPFEGFLPSISFNESHLMHWRDIADRATAFLQSKEYR